MWEKIKRIAPIALVLLILASCTPSNNLNNPAFESPTSDQVQDPTQTEEIDKPTGPQIVEVTPLNGKELVAEPVITIKFDTKMDRDTTEAVFTFYGADDQEILGTFSWPDTNTLKFYPAEILQQGVDYTVVIGTDAASDTLINLSEEIVLHFNATPGLNVGNVFPEDNSKEVDPDTGITVLFNQPVEPLRIYEEQENAAQPLNFQPEIEGTGKWVNSSTYIFQPEKPLASGTSYTVKIAAGLEDIAGNKLENDFQWEFATANPKIRFLYQISLGRHNKVSDDITGVLLDDSFEIEFMQAMDTESVASALKIVKRDNNEKIPIALSWDETNTVLTITPQDRLAVGEKYSLRLSTAAQDTSGGQLEENLELDFDTVTTPKVVNTYPEDKDKQRNYSSILSVSFNTPMDPETFAEHVQISPEPEAEFEWYYSDYWYEFSAYFLSPSTEYTITILPGVQDMYGNQMEEAYTFSFETAGRNPRASVMMPYYPLIYRENTTQNFFLNYTNLDEMTASLYQLTDSEFLNVVNNGLSSASTISRDDPEWRWELEQETPQDENIIKEFVLTTPEDEPLPAGFYMIGLEAEPLETFYNLVDFGLMVVATDNIVMKATKTEATIWVTDINTGEPVPNVPVKLYSYNFLYLAEVVTDENGIASISGVEKAEIAVINTKDHLAFGYLDTGSGVSPGEFGIWTNYYSGTTNLYAYLYTDRPLYRPGQEMHYKGILRFEDDLDYSISGIQNVRIEITHQGDIVFTDSVTVNSMGTFAGDFTIDEQASLGTYTIKAIHSKDSNETLGTITFSVAEYQKPEFEVIVSNAKDEILLGEDLNFDVNANYYSGGFVSNAEISWSMKAEEYIFRPDSPYQRYRFNNTDYYTYSEKAKDITLSSGVNKADIQGHLELSYPSQDASITGSHSVILQANVTDAAGNLVSGRNSIIIHQSEYYAGIRTQQYIGRADESQIFEIVVLDWTSNPVPNTGVLVEIFKTEWHSVQERDESGRLRWVSTMEEIPVTEISGLVTDENGKVNAEFIPEDGGSYKAYVTVTDSKANQHTATTRIWISSRKYVSWRQTNDNSFELILNQDAYSPGDTAEIMIAQPFENDVYALVTVERGHIQSSEVILLDSNSVIYELPITAEMAPKVYVSVAVIQGADYSSNGTILKMGMAEIDVDTSAQTLNIDISTDVENAGPGDQVTYTVAVTDRDGLPVQSEVSFSLVDKALLALTTSNSGEIVSSFYPERSLSVKTSSSSVLNAELYNSQIEATTPGENGGEGSGGKGGGLMGIITVRENFKDTAYFEAQVQTNANGNASVTVTLPDNLTTWQMDVRAVTTDTQIGQVTHDLVSTKPLIVGLQTPPFFVAEDTAQIGALLLNNTDEDLDVDLYLESTGVAFDTDQNQTVTVAAGQQSYVTWDISIPIESDRVDFTIHANSGTYTDSSKPAAGTLDNHGIPVLRYATTENVGSTGMLNNGESITEAIQPPLSMEYYSAQLMVETSPSLAAGLKNGISYLKTYSYYCNEQVSSRLLSNLLNYRIIQLSGKDPDDIEDELISNIELGMAHLYATQNSDGGWGWWNGPSHKTTSTYVLDVLLVAEETGFPISKTVRSAAVSYINGRIRYATNSLYEHNRKAYMIYVVSRAGWGSTSRIDRLFEDRDRLSFYAKAFLLQAMQLEEMNPDHIKILKNELMDAAFISATSVHWEETSRDYMNWNSDVRTTAIVMNALLHTDPEIELLPGAIRWLMSNRTGNHWYSTQDTAWTLRGLTDWLEFSDEFSADYEYLVTLNGEDLYSGIANSDNIDIPVTVAASLDGFGDELSYLQINRSEGPGKLYYTMYATITLPVKEVQAMSNGVIVSREYYRLDDLETPVTEVSQGEIVQVRITLIAPQSLHYVVIDDPLPAGLAALDQTLLTNPEIPSGLSYDDIYTSGWGWWYFDHTEMYDEKTTISAEYLPAGTYVYTYYARAATPGSYNVIPTTVQEFYFPDVFGRVDGSVFVITP